MVVLLRFLKSLFTSLFLPRIDPLGEGVVTMRAWPNDLDLNMHVTSGRYLSFMDIGRVALLVRMRVLRKVVRRGWRPVVGAAMITYRKSILPFQKFRVRSRVVCWDEKWFYFEHIIENAAGETVAVANVRGVLRGRNGNVPPKDLVALTGHHFESPPMPERIERWRAALVRE